MNDNGFWLTEMHSPQIVSLNPSSVRLALRGILLGPISRTGNDICSYGRNMKEEQLTAPSR
jgi:hypothetical protein